jgi:hypothetical protein
MTAISNLHDSDTTANYLEDLVSVSDSLDKTNDDGKTAHCYRDGVHEEGVVPGLRHQSLNQLSHAWTHAPVSHNPSPRRKVRVDEVAGEEVEKVDKYTCKLVGQLDTCVHDITYEGSVQYTSRHDWVFGKESIPDSP